MNNSKLTTSSYILTNINRKMDFTWKELVAFVESEVTVTNWLTEVRSVLQWYIDKGQIVREQNIFTESYNICS